MIKNFTLKALQKAINRALALDDASPYKIRALQGKTLKVVIAPLQVHFYIQFSENELELLGEHAGVVDTTISSSPLGLIRLSLLPASKVRSLFNDQIKVTGDVELGQKVKQLFDELDIDWEGHLAQFTGDVVAHQIGSFFRQGRAFKQRTASSIQRQLSDYLHEEIHMVPSKEELDDFFKDVDDLSLHAERLSARINQLMSKHEID